MSLRIRLLALTALLSAAAAVPVFAQRGMVRSRPETVRIRRPPYSYFKYRIPSQSLRITPGVDFQRRALERAMERRQQVLDRQFALRERTLAMQDRAWRRQLEVRERAMERMRDRLDRMARLRPFANRRHWRTI